MREIARTIGRDPGTGSRELRRSAATGGGKQIAQRLKVEFPDDESMRISHEAIYQSLFIEGRGALKREVVTCLRTGRALGEPRVRSRNKAQGHSPPMSSSAGGPPKPRAPVSTSLDL